MHILARIFSFATIAIAANAQAGDRAGRLDLEAPYIVSTTINGQTVNFDVEPEFDTALRIINADKAKALGLKKTMIGISEYVGPIGLRGATKVVPLQLGGTTAQVRVARYDRAISIEADGIITPAGLPYQVVSLRLRKPSPDEHSVVFQLDKVKDSAFSFEGGQAYTMLGDKKSASVSTSTGYKHLLRLRRVDC